MTAFIITLSLSISLSLSLSLPFSLSREREGGRERGTEGERGRERELSGPIASLGRRIAAALHQHGLRRLKVSSIGSPPSRSGAGRLKLSCGSDAAATLGGALKGDDGDGHGESSSRAGMMRTASMSALHETPARELRRSEDARRSEERRRRCIFVRMLSGAGSLSCRSAGAASTCGCGFAYVMYVSCICWQDISRAPMNTVRQSMACVSGGGCRSSSSTSRPGSKPLSLWNEVFPFHQQWKNLVTGFYDRRFYYTRDHQRERGVDLPVSSKSHLHFVVKIDFT